MVGTAEACAKVAFLVSALPSPPPFVPVDRVERALEKLASRAFDLVLFDLDLHARDSRAVLRRMVAREPIVPIVVLVGASVDAESPQALADAGALGLLDLATLSIDLLERTLSFSVEIGRRLAKWHTLAHRDALTGLHNRRALERRLDRASLDVSGTLVSLLFVDVDGFKRVNDRLGHANGDILLQTLAARLRGVVRGEVTIARIGGDEFAVFLEGIESADVAELVARRVVDAFERPISVAGQQVLLSASVGIAFARTGEASVRGLLDEADSAMYEAKELSGGCYVFGATLELARH